jgi:hypothetical protein
VLDFIKTFFIQSYDYVTQLKTVFIMVDYFTFFVSFLILIFAHKIFPSKKITGKSDKYYKKKIKYLRVVSLILITFYLLNIFNGFDFLASVSQSFLTVITGIGVYHWVSFIIVEKYGDESKKIAGIKECNYVTQLITMSLLILISLLTFITLLNSWNMNSALETTSAFGILALLFFSTKDYWVDSVISAFIILINGHIPRGSLIKIPSDNILGIIQAVTFSHTVIKDLSCEKTIFIPTSHLRTEKYEILANDDITSIKDFIDFKIGYGTDITIIRDFFESVFAKVKKDKNGKTGIDFDLSFSLRNLSNGDHAVVWRFFYTLRQPRNILKARDAVNKAAYELQDSNIQLSTPISHTQH